MLRVRGLRLGLAAVGLVAVAFVVAMVVAPVASAATPKVSASMGVGCRASSGQAVVKLTLNASGSGGAVVTKRSLDVGNPLDGVPEFSDLPGVTNPPAHVFQQTIVAPGTTTLFIKYTVEGSNGAPAVVRTGKAVVTLNGNSVSCRVSTP